MKPRLVIAGGSGFLGSVLAQHFYRCGWEVTVLTRRPGPSTELVRDILWDGATLGEWAQEFEGARALINLAGVSVNCRYHARNRKQILDSRVHSTKILGEALSRCDNPPEVWLNSSTATIYRHTYGAAWDELGAIGSCAAAKDAFSVEVAQAWEQTFNTANTPRTRKVNLRTAMVLGTGGNSVLPTLRRLVRLGLGGSLAGGRQYVSWIHEGDFCRAIEWLIENRESTGTFNLASPHPLTNTEMMRTLRLLCHAPVGLPATLWMLELGAFLLRTETELVIKSRRVVPQRLLQGGFTFMHPCFGPAYEDLLGRLQRPSA